tara:strand:- start:268 stop:2529 length:2262 start_codon:yes stop_codon:yes gene_type:complete
MNKSKTKKIKNSKSDSKSQSDEIIISPAIKEAKETTAVFSFGRYNPPTKGHEVLVSKLRDIARKEKGIPLLFLSQTFDAQKNPLPYADKFKLAAKAFGNDLLRRSKANNIIGLLKELSGQYDNVVIVAGSDRVSEYERLAMYNGKDFKFKSYKVVSAGTRDPDAEGTASMSASKLRAAVKDDDKASFKKGIASKLSSISDKVFNMVRSGMELAEQLESEGLLTEVLNTQQRRARGIMMRRYRTKLQRGRKIASKKTASTAKLKKRAARKAIGFMRKKLAGKRGVNYRNLSPAAKQAIDKRVATKKTMIKKISKRLMPRVRKGEMERLSRMRSRKANESIDQYFTNYLNEANFKVDIEGLPSIYVQSNSAGKVKTELRKLIKKPEENITNIERVLPSDLRKAFKLRMQGKEDTENMDEAKRKFTNDEIKKANAISAMARTPADAERKIASKMKLSRTDAKDLVNAAVRKMLGLKEDKDPCWKDYRQLGVKKKNGKTVPNCIPKEELNKAFKEIYVSRKYLKTLKNPKKWKVGPPRSPYAPSTSKPTKPTKPTKPQTYKEKLTKKSTAGDFIDDFKKSDKPQFKGKSDEKKKDMAIAAYLQKQNKQEAAIKPPKPSFNRITKRTIQNKHIKKAQSAYDKNKDVLAKHGFKRPTVEMTDEQLLMVVDRMIGSVSNTPYDKLDERAKNNLNDKCKAYIDSDKIISLYNEGVSKWDNTMDMTEQQAGYANVNSFLAFNNKTIKEQINSNFTNFIKRKK